MFENLIANIAKERGRYPVANLVSDHLKAFSSRGPFYLGTWLSALDQPTLEDIQTKLDMFLSGGGPDHAGEDLLIAVDLLSSAEAGAPVDLSDLEMKHRLLAWFEAGLLEKLSRHGLATLQAPTSIDPAKGPQVALDEAVLNQLAAARAAPSKPRLP